MQKKNTQCVIHSTEASHRWQTGWSLSLLPWTWKSWQHGGGTTSTISWFSTLSSANMPKTRLLRNMQPGFSTSWTTFGCCEMPAGVRRFISFHIAAKTQYITMHSTLVCEALFHILRQQNISLKINRWRPSSPDRAGRWERREIMVKFALRQVNCSLRER